MAATLFSSFEILAELLVPVDLVPPGDLNPFLIQGYFIQISLRPGKGTTGFDITFKETTGFKQGDNPTALLAQVINAQGIVNTYPNFISSGPSGFLGQTINPGETLLFGVQAIPIAATGLDAPFPQAGIGWHGTVSINPYVDNSSLVATATHRQIFLQGPTIKSGAISGAAYAVPSFSGNGLV